MSKPQAPNSMAPNSSVTVGNVVFDNNAALGADRRPVPVRIAPARLRHGRRAEGTDRQARHRPRLQDQLRQGQPHLAVGDARRRHGRGTSGLRRAAQGVFASHSDRRPHRGAVRDRRAACRCAADSGLPVAPDRHAGRRRQDRQGDQRQEGAVPRALGHEERRRQDHRFGQPQRAHHRARRFLRLQHAGVRHARSADHGRDRRAGDFRRHPFGAAAGRAGRFFRRRAPLCRDAGPRCRRRRRRRRVHRDPSGSRQFDLFRRSRTCCR